MKPTKNLTLGFLTLFLLTGSTNSLFGFGADWIIETSGQWEVDGNWSGGVAPGTSGINAADGATFLATPPSSPSLITVTTTGSLGLNRINFLPFSTSNYQIVSSNNGTIHFNPVPGGIPYGTIHSDGTAVQTINMPINLEQASLVITADGTSKLIVQRDITDNGIGSADLTFVGPGDLEMFPQLGVSTRIQVQGAFTQNSGRVTNYNNLPVSGGASGGNIQAITSFSVIGGTYTNQNEGQVFANSSGCTTGTSGPMIINSGATYLSQNNGQVVGSGASGILSVWGLPNMPAATTINGTYIGINNGDIAYSGAGGSFGIDFNAIGPLNLNGTVSLINNGNVHNGITGNSDTGCRMNAFATLAIPGGIIDVQNTGAVSAVGRGSRLSAIGATSISGGTITFLNDTSGVITDSGIGVFFRAGSTLGMTDGLMTITNQAPIADMASGVVVQTSDAITLRGGQIIFTNRGAVSGTQGAVLTQFGGDFNLNGGQVSFTNKGEIGSGSQTHSIGAGFFQNAGKIVINNGTLFAVNSGLTKSYAAVPIIASAADFILNQGTVTGSNSGSIAASGTEDNIFNGVLFSSLGFEMNGGSFSLDNSATLNSTFTAGSGLYTGDITLNDGTLSLSNTGQIKGDDSTGTLLSAGGSFLLTGGSLTGLNKGAIQGIAEGVSIESQGPVSISGGQINIASTIDGSVNGNAVGSLLYTLDTLTLNTSGSLQAQNESPTSNTAYGVEIRAGKESTVNGGTLIVTAKGQALDSSVGAIYQQETEDFNLDAGQVSFTNFAQIGVDAKSTAVGALFHAEAGDVEINQGNFNAYNYGEVKANVGTLIQGSANLTLNGGAMLALNNGTLSGTGTATQSLRGTSYEFGKFQINGGIATFDNLGLLSTPFTMGSRLSSSTAEFNAGTVILVNEGTITGDNSIGAAMQASQSLLINGATVTATNTKNISGKGCGTSLESAGSFMLSNGSLVILNDTAAGQTTTISGSGIGSQLKASKTFGMTGGTMTVTNKGSISGSASGAGIQASTTTMNAGQLTLNNTTSVADASTGVFFQQTSGDFNLNGGQLSFGNAGPVNNGTNTAAAGALFNQLAGKTNMNNGTFAATNSGIVTKGIGTLIQGADDLTLTNGSLSATNSAALTGNGTATLPVIGTSYSPNRFISNGGTFALLNTGAINGSFAIGTNLSTQTILLNKGTNTLTNKGQVSVDNSVGTAFQAKQDFQVNGATVSSTNLANVAAKSVGSSLESVGTMSLSSGTVAILNDTVATISSNGIGSQLNAGQTLAVTGGLLSATNKGPVNSSGTGVLVQVGTGTTLNGGILNISNSADIAQAGQGVVFQQTAGNFVLNNGLIGFSNSAQVDGGTNQTPVGALFKQSADGLIVNSGTFSAMNTGTIKRNVGVFIQELGNITLTSGTISGTNAGQISASSALPATGTSFSANQFSMSGGNFVLNNGGILASPSAIGANLTAQTIQLSNGTANLGNTIAINSNGSVGTAIQASQTLLVDGATLNSTNSANLSASACGSSVESAGSTTISAGSVNIVNSDAATISGTAVGSQLKTLTTLAVSGGALNVTNTGAVNSSGSGAQAQIAAGTTLSGGQVNLNNTGAIIDAGIGSQLNALAALQVSGGTLNVKNAGSINSSGTGAQVQIATGATLSSGQVNVNNTGSTANSAIGALLQQTSGDFNVSGGALSLTNSGSINTGASQTAVGSVYKQPSGKTIVNGGTFSASNSGLIQAQAGTLVQISDTLTLNKGTLSGSNNGQLVSVASFKQGPLGLSTISVAGTSYVVNHFIVNGGSFDLINSATLDSTQTAGSNLISSDIQLNNGNINLNNSGIISGSNSIGAIIQSEKDLLINGGTVSAGNTAIIETQGFGTAIEAGQTMQLNKGTINLSNSGQINSNNSIGSIIQSAGTLAINEGTLSAKNTGDIGAPGFGTAIIANQTMQIKQSTITLGNSGAISPNAGCGSTIQAKQDLSLENSTVTLSNMGIINENGIGTSIDVVGQLSLKNGDLRISNTASGMVSGIAAGSQVNLLKDLQITDGNMTASNLGVVMDAASGVEINVGTDVVLNGGQIQLANAGTIGSDGSDFEIPFAGRKSDVNVKQKSFALNQSDRIGQAAKLTPTGIFFNLDTGKLTLNKGVFAAENSGLVDTKSTGLTVQGSNDLTLNEGAIRAANSGTLKGTNSKGIAYSFNSFTMNGGTVSLSNRASLDALSTVGSSFAASNIQINKGTITLQNTGKITGSNNSGSLLQAKETLLINGGTVVVKANAGSAKGTGNRGSRVQALKNLQIKKGTLINDDRVETPKLEVLAKGKLSGKGSFTNLDGAKTTVFTNSGTVTPGSLETSPLNTAKQGVMTVVGGYKQTSSGILNVDILNQENFSQLNILGANTNANLTQAGPLKITLLPGANITPTDKFIIVQTENSQGVSGTFSNVIEAQNLQTTVQYLPNQVVLSFIPTVSTFIGNYLLPLVSSVNETNIRLGRKMAALHERMDKKPAPQAMAAVTRDNATYLASNKLMKAPTKNEEMAATPLQASKQPWSFYFGPTGNVGEVSASGKQTGFDYWSTGALAGFDYAFSQVGLGLLVDYDYIHGHRKSVGKFNINEAHGSLYGTYSPEKLPQLAFNTIVGGSYEWYELDRVASTQMNAQTTGHTNGGEFDALFGCEYTLQQVRNMPESLKVVPLASLQYMYIRANDYNEKNGGIHNLHYDDQTLQSLRMTLGSRFNYVWTKSDFVKIVAELDCAWQREFMNHQLAVDFKPLAYVQPTSQLLVPGSGRNVVLAGIDLETIFKDKYGFEMNYDFEWNERFLDHSFFVGFNARF